MAGFRDMACIAAVLTVLAGSSAAAEKWDMPVAYAESNYHTQLDKMFAEAVGVATDGALEVVVHSGGSLYKGDEIKRAVQTGQALIGERLLSAHENETPLYAFESQPFLATTFDEAAVLWEAAKPIVERTMREQNLVLLYSVPWPPAGIFTDRPLNSAADLDGVKIRTFNPATARIAEMSGAIPVQIEAAELTQALATGIAEGFISSAPTGVDRKVWEHLTHYYDVGFWIARNFVFANKDAWEALDEGKRNAIRGVAVMTEQAGIFRTKQLADWYKSELARNGMTVGPAGEELREDFAKIGEAMLDTWLERVGDDGRTLVEAYRKGLPQ